MERQRRHLPRFLISVSLCVCVLVKLSYTTVLTTIDPFVKEVTWCERPANQIRTLRPRIWLIAALSFSVHSATTLARISFIYSMKAFRGFLMWGLLGSCSFLWSCWDFLEKQEEERVKKEGEELLSDTGKYKGEKRSEGGAKAAATATPWSVRAPNVWFQQPIGRPHERTIWEPVPKS